MQSGKWKVELSRLQTTKREIAAPAFALVCIAAPLWNGCSTVLFVEALVKLTSSSHPHLLLTMGENHYQQQQQQTTRWKVRLILHVNRPTKRQQKLSSWLVGLHLHWLILNSLMLAYPHTGIKGCCALWTLVWSLQFFVVFLFPLTVVQRRSLSHRQWFFSLSVCYFSAALDK